MNKVYRTVFNEKTNTWVAVAETAKAHGKSGRSGDVVTAVADGILLNKKVLAVSAAVAAALVSQPAMADNARIENGSAQWTIAISPSDSTAGNGGAKATGKTSIAAGWDAKADGENSIAVGYGASTETNSATYYRIQNVPDKTMNNIAIGKQARSGGLQTIAFGPESVASKSQSIAFGFDAQATGDQSVALGANTRSAGDSSIAIGGDDLDSVASTVYRMTSPTADNDAYNDTALAKQYRTLTGQNLVNFTPGNRYIGTSTGQAGVAVGVSAKAADLSTAVGAKSHATGEHSVAFGVGASSSLKNAVALGAGSSTKTNATDVKSATVGSITYGSAATPFAGSGQVIDGDQVSVGSTGYERQIKHVAPGEITAASTDAINGSQLFYVAKGLQEQISNPAFATHYYSVKGNSSADGNYNNDGATGDKALAAGVNASAKTNNSIAIGTNATVESGTATSASGTTTGVGSVAVGADSSAKGTNAAAFGQKSEAFGQNSLAAGQDSHATGKSSVAIGDGAKASEGQATAVGVGTNASAGGASAYGYLTQASGYLSTAIGNQANAKGAHSVAISKAVAAEENTIAIGNNATANSIGSVSIGRNASATGQNSVVVGTSNTSSANNAVVVGTSSQATKENTIAIGNKAVAYNTGNIVLGTNSGKINDANNIANVGADGILIGANAGTDSYGNAHQVAVGFNSGRYLSGTGNVAIGDNAGSGTSANRLTASNTVALGTNAQASKNDAIAIGQKSTSTATKGIAIGAGAQANHDNGVALGSDSETAAAVPTTDATINGVTYSGFAGTAPTSTVSIGKSGGERTLTNVAAGRITDTSTDAINGSQLYSVVNGLGFDVNADNDAAKTHKLGKELAIVAGNTAEATSTSNLKTEVTQDSATGKTTVTVSMKEAPNFTSVTTTDAAGNKTVTNGSGVTITPASGNPVSLTTGGLNNGGNKITNVAEGAAGTDAVNVDQLKAAVATTPLTVANGKVTPPTAADANKLATAGDIANAINNSGFQATAGGNLASGSNATPTTVKPGQKVTFAAGNGLTVKQDIDNASGNQTYTYALDAQSVVQDAQTPVVYTKADGSKVYKQPDGKFYDAPTGGNEVAAGDVIASMQDGAGSTTAPTTLANVKSNLADAGNAVTNPAGNSRTDLAGKGNNAATVNDVLNSGFTVQGNGQDKDFVTHGDTINFANGQGTVANVTSTNGVTTVKFDTPMTYADASGNPTSTPSNKVNLVGGTAGSPVTLGNVADGTVAAGSKEAVNGGQLHDLKEKGFKIAADNGTPDTVKLTETVKYAGDSNIVTTVKDNEIGFKLGDSITVGPAAGGNPVKVDGNTGTVTGLTNKTWNPAAITSGRAATEDQLKAAVATTPLTVANGKVTPPTAADANKLATAGDIANAINNSGFQATAGGNLASGSNATPTTVKPGQKVTFAAGNGLTVKQDIDNASGNQTYTYALDAQSVVQDAQTPVVYTKADGSKVYKQPDGKFYDAPTGGNEVAAGDVIASMQDGAGSTTAPTTLANVKSNLADAGNAVTNPAGNSRTDLAGKGNNAATVNDVLNSGFTVQGNGQDKDFVTHGDTINFANGQGTVANVTSTNGVTTVKFDTPMTYADASGNPTSTPSNKVNLVGGTAGSPVTLGNVADGTVAAGSKEAVNGSQLHATNQNVANNAANIAKGINFGGTTGSNNYRLGDTINVKGDSNITSTTVAGGAQLALNPNLNVTSVTTTDAAGNKTVTNGSGVTITPASGNPVSLTTGGLNNGGNKITNVAAGTAGTDAVNVSQLNQALGSITGVNTANFTALENKVNEVAADAKAGTAAAMAVAGLPQAYLPGKSMMAVGGSVYRGESGYAIGYSTISDGGNWIIKGTATGNSRGHYGATAAVGYQW